MAVNGELERMTSSDLDLTSQTETEDTDTGDLEDSGTTFSSSEGTETSISAISSSSATESSKESRNGDMNSLSSADGSTSTGTVDPSDSEQSNTVFKYPTLPKFSFDLTEVSELSNYENLSNYEYKTSSKSPMKEKKAGPKNKDKKTFQFPDFMSMKGDWYKHPCFKNYWDHYDRVMSWCSKHYQVYNSIIKRDSSQNSATQSQDFNQISSMLSWQQSYLNPYFANLGHQLHKPSNGSSISVSSSKKKSMKKKRKKRKAKSKSQKGQSENTEESDENFEMEITDEMMEFFKKSEEHRREREKQKTINEVTGEKEQERVNVEEVRATATKGPTTQAPKQRPGARRTSEMKLLYGKGAPMIHGMETALQMTFDRNLDVNQPKMWPNMPLKLVFG